MTRNRLKKFMILLLMLDALWVFILQILRINPWMFVCAYWAILTVKNSLDLGV